MRRGPRWLPGCRGSLGRRGGGLETGRTAETLEWSWGESQRSWWAGRMMEFNLPFPQKDQRKEGASVSGKALRFLEPLRPGLGQGRPSLVTGTFLPAPRGREAAGKMLNLKRRSTKCLRPLVPHPHPQNSFDQETCARPVTCSARQDARGAGYQDRRISSWCMYHSPSLSASNRPD